MNERKLNEYLDALADGQRPGPFEPDQEEVDALRVAIALRAARPGDAVPDDAFVAALHQTLADQADSSSAPANVHLLRMRRTRAVLVGVAASLALVGGTFAATEAAQQPAATRSAVPAPNAKDLRTGTFETNDGQALGQIVAYNGHPSWVYMDVGLDQSSGTVMCKLQLDNGSIVAAGTIVLHDGAGHLSKSISVNTGRLRGATLYNSSGAVVGLATFA
jgi:hypothetical protein